MPTWSLNNSIRTPLLLLGIVELSVLVLSVYVGGVVAFGGMSDWESSLVPMFPRAATVAGVMLVSLIAMGLYQFHQRAYFREVLVRVAVAVVMGSAILAAVFYFIPSIELPPRMAALTALSALLFLLIVRYFFVRNVDDNIFRRRTLVYGAGERASAISDLRRRADRRGFHVVGTIPAPGDTQGTDNSGLLIGSKSLMHIAADTDADEIVIAMDDRRGNLPVRELLDCKLSGVQVIDLVEFLERETGKIRIDLVNPGWLIFRPGFRVTYFPRVFKRAVDLIVALGALLFSWPLMLLITVAIKIEDGISSSVMYKQQRVGLHGKQFQLLKFRSMSEDAEADGKAVWAAENDHRITKFGGLIRKFRLDELPQIFNVLRGEMSLVGPRPERPEFVDQLAEKISYYMERHTVMPGVTGWAQLRYPYGSSEEDAAEKLQYDLYYVKNHNLLLDLMILIQTIEVVVWGKGAR